ncbi:MAG: hypothetical protein ABSH47_19715 [Bryobacteraceae bacterium]
MSDSATTQARFEKWSVPECPFTVEYRHGLMQELRAAVAYGQQAFTRGGMEVGGVLLGTRSAGGPSIRAWRPIACEHANGPALVLSGRDRDELKKFLDEAATLPDLAGIEPVGWFLSHTRSDISLRESDLNLYQEFFPAASDVALVLRPGRHGAARAGFFFRDPEGAVQSDHSLLEFNIEGEGGWASIPVDRTPAHPAEISAPPERRRRGAASTPVDTASAFVQTTRGDVPELDPVATPPANGESEPVLTGKRSWRWIALPVAALVAIGWLYLARNRAPEPAVTPIEMTVTDRGGQLVVEWDRSRPELQRVRAGEISVTDAGSRVSIALSAAEAQTGSFTWARKSGDVQVSLHFDGAGKPLSASAHFLGVVPPHQKPEHDTAELDRLRKENVELRGEVDRAKARADQAETAVRVLRERLDAVEPKK